MNKTLIPMIGVLVVGATITACAGPEGTDKFVRPLANGPRTRMTPWANQQRLLRNEQAAHARAEAKGTPQVDQK